MGENERRSFSIFVPFPFRPFLSFPSHFLRLPLGPRWVSNGKKSVPHLLITRREFIAVVAIRIQFSNATMLVKMASIQKNKIAETINI